MMRIFALFVASAMFPWLCIGTSLKQSVQSQVQSMCYNRDQSELDALPVQNIGELFAQVATTNYRVNSYQLWQSSNCIYNFNPLTKFAWQTTGANIAQLSNANECFEIGAKFYLWINAEAAVCGYMVPVTFVYQPSTAGVIVYFTGTVDIIYDNVVTMPTYSVSNLYALLDTTNYAMNYYSMWESTYCSYNIDASPTINGVTTNFDFPTMMTSVPKGCFKQGAKFYVWANPAAAVLAYMTPMTFVIDYDIQFQDPPEGSSNGNGAIMQLSFTGTVDNVDSSIITLPTYQVSGFIAMINTRAYYGRILDAWQSANCIASEYIIDPYTNSSLFYNSHRTSECFQEGTYNTLWMNPKFAVKAYMVPAIFYVNYSAPWIQVYFGGSVDAVSSSLDVVTNQFPVSIMAMHFNFSYYNVTEIVFNEPATQCQTIRRPSNSENFAINTTELYSWNPYNKYPCFDEYSNFKVTLSYYLKPQSGQKGLTTRYQYTIPINMFIMSNVNVLGFRFGNKNITPMEYGYVPFNNQTKEYINSHE